MIHCPPQRMSRSIRIIKSNHDPAHAHNVPSPTAQTPGPEVPTNLTTNGTEEVGLRPEHDSQNARVRSATRGLRRLDAPPGTTGGTGWLASWWVSMIHPAAAPP
jgi:hypothetical protein